MNQEHSPDELLDDALKKIESDGNVDPAKISSIREAIRNLAQVRQQLQTELTPGPRQSEQVMQQRSVEIEERAKMIQDSWNQVRATLVEQTSLLNQIAQRTRDKRKLP